MKRRSCLPLFFAFTILVFTTSCQQPTPLPTATLTPVPTSTVAPTPTPTLIPTSTAIPKLEAGNYSRVMVVDNLYREYYLHIPEGLDNQQPAPVVFFIPGWGDDPLLLKYNSGIEKLANEKAFILILPYGTGRSWNAGGCCGNALVNNRDDIKYFKLVISDLNTIATIDTARIYALGWDNGAMMAYRLACEMSDTFAAIAPFAGAMFYSPCNPKQPVSVLHVHGTELDTMFPYAGGPAADEWWFMKDYILPPVEEGIATWVKINGCGNTPTEEITSLTTHVIYPNCQAGTAVEIIKSEFFDHDWSIINASKIWDFFAAHPKSSPLPAINPIPVSVPAASAFPNEYKQTFKIGDYNLTLECKGQGEPTIILEDGYGYKSWPYEYLYRFIHLGRTCTYARPGINGEKVTHLRTTQDQVQDLHDLLTQAGVPGPYILVGHSIAAFNILMYTDQYPQDVVGLVCVDCRAPSFTSLVLEKYGPEQPDDPAGVKDFRQAFTQVSEDEYENIDFPTSQAQVMKVTSLGNRPFVVLLNLVFPSSVGSEKFDKLTNEAWNEASITLSKLSSHSRLETVQNCDHFSILYSSRVDFAVEEVYMEVK